LRRADAAEELDDFGRVEVDGIFEYSDAIAVRKTVSERW
jgi:hypothetical protein